MGLDISVYSKIVLIDGDTREGEGYDEKYWGKTDFETMYIWDGFFTRDDMHHAPWTNGLQPGVYRVDGKAYDFRAGSYSGYNHWREKLCMMAHHISPPTIWSDPDKFKDVKFFYLINFSDCEGVIGPEIAKHLAKDFADFQETVDNLPNDEEYEWFKSQYAKWRKAFELASDNGCVKFH